MRTLFSALCILFFGGGSARASESHAPASGRWDLSRDLDYWIDAEGTETFASIRTKPVSDWLSARGAIANFGFRSEVFWFRLQLPACEEDSGHHRILEVAYPLLDSIDTWEIVGDHTPIAHHVGDKAPFSARPINHIALAVPVGCAAATTMILRVASTSAMQLPIVLWDDAAFMENAAQGEMPLFFYFGAMLIMAIYNTFVFISVRKLSYLFYVSFILSFAAFQAGLSGFGFRYLWPNLPVINDYIIDKSLNFVVIFAFGFAIQYMRAKALFPRLYRVSFSFLWMIVGYSTISFFLPYRIAIKITIGLIMVAIFLGFFVNLKSILKKQREGYFYVGAWAMFLSGAFVLAMNKLGILPRNMLTENSVQFASVLEALILSFALADQLNILRRNLKTTLDSIEQIVAEKTENIRSILDTVQQGIMTVRGRELRIEAEFSPYTTRTLGLGQLSGMPVKAAFLDKLDISEDQRRRIESALLACLEDGQIAFELNASQFPHELRLQTAEGMRDLVVDWTPILRDSNAIDRFLIVFRDVTDWKKLESIQATQDEMLLKLQQMMRADPFLLRKFLLHAEKLLDEHLSISMHVDPATILKNLFIDIHTLKGEARSLGLQDLADACHQLEDGMARMRNGQLEKSQINLQTMLLKAQRVLHSYQSIYQERLKGIIGDGDVVVKGEMLQRWKQELVTHDTEAFEHILTDIHSLLYLGFDHFHAKLRRWCRRIAQDLGRPEPKLEILSNLAYLDNRVSDVLDKIFIHLLQNALAHGIETPEVRRMHGKPGQGSIQIHFENRGSSVRIVMRDDGRGFDQGRIQRKAAVLGLIAGDRKLSLDRMKELVLTSGFSSLESAHSYAGRGVGLDAVQGLVKQLQGNMDIELYPEIVAGFIPFAVIIDLPAAAFPVAA